MIFLKSYFVNTTAEVDFLPITSDVNYAIRDGQGKDGLVTIVVPSGRAAITVFEPLPEVISELKSALEIFAGEGKETADKRKEQVFIAPRVQTAMLGRSLTIPIKDAKLVLDPYEEIYLIDFDKKAHRREFIVQVMSVEAPAAESAGARGVPPKKK